MKYDLLMPRKVVHGWGRRVECGSLARALGSRAFVITGSRTLLASGLLDSVFGSLKAAGISHEHLLNVTREPEVADVDAAVARVRELGVKPGDFVLAIGGGAAIDLAKALAALATNDQSPTVKDYLEGVGRGLTLQQAPLSVLAMPTTSGTGSEATKNSVISNPDPAFKKSLRSELMVPHTVLIDPELTVTNSRSVTVHSGVDAITQLIESAITVKSQPVTFALCLEGLRTVVPALLETAANPQSRPAREAMSHAAFLSGVTLANSGLGMAHGVAAALGVTCQQPHGFACAIMLPTALRVNASVKASELTTIGRAIAKSLREWKFDDRFAASLQSQADQLLADLSFKCQQPVEPLAQSTVTLVTRLCNLLEIPPRLRDVGVKREQLPELARGSQGNSLSGNPQPLTSDDVLKLLEEIW